MHFHTPGYEDFELSTQLVIREALSRGCEVDVLDRRDQFIRVRGPVGSAYIKQATRTGADSYIAPLLMQNKLVTKNILEEAGIRVPKGECLGAPEAAPAAFPRWRGRPLVIKPKSAEFGTGVSMFPNGADQKEFVSAIRDALKHAEEALIEEFLPGGEHRFLVIGGRSRASLRRIPANVEGDGAATIRDLVDRKNASPLRGKGYVSPLEKIVIGAVETAFLAAQGLAPTSVAAAGETVFLRANSNVSTGGDSIDCTDEVHPGYADIAAAAAAAVGARICGVDIVITEPEEAPNGENFGIIELNFNPALHIHDFPFRGRNRQVEKYVLDLLGF